VNQIERTPSPREIAALGRRLGFRRLDLVRLTIDEDTIRADAIGVVHRLPRETPISLSLATRLVRAGLPLTIRDPDGGPLDRPAGALDQSAPR